MIAFTKPGNIAPEPENAHMGHVQRCPHPDFVPRGSARGNAWLDAICAFPEDLHASLMYTVRGSKRKFLAKIPSSDMRGVLEMMVNAR